jgi:hypothetical protein
MSMALHVSQRHNRDQAANMKARSRGIKTDVAGGGTLEQIRDGLIARGLFNETTLLQYIENILQRLSVSSHNRNNGMVEYWKIGILGSNEGKKTIRR